MSNIYTVDEGRDKGGLKDVELFLTGKRAVPDKPKLELLSLVDLTPNPKPKPYSPSPRCYKSKAANKSTTAQVKL